MTSVIDAIVKLPRYVRLLSTNGIDQNNAVVLDDIDDKGVNPKYERQHAWYERNRERLLEYFHDRYLLKKEDILQKKREYNKQPHVKERLAKYHKKYYQEHKKNKIKIKK